MPWLLPASGPATLCQGFPVQVLPSPPGRLQPEEGNLQSSAIQAKSERARVDGRALAHTPLQSPCLGPTHTSRQCLGR